MLGLLTTLGIIVLVAILAPVLLSIVVALMPLIVKIVACVVAFKFGIMIYNTIRNK